MTTSTSSATRLDPLAMEKIPSNILQRQTAAADRMENGARFWLTEAAANSRYQKREFFFASIHNHDSSAAQSIPTGTTYTKITNFTDNGASMNCTPDAANDKITITETGYYHIAASLNFQCGTNNVIWRMAPFLDGVEFEEVHIKRKVGTAGDVGSASFVGIIDVTSVPVDLDIRARHDNGGAVNLTVEYANFTIHRIAET